MKYLQSLLFFLFLLSGGLVFGQECSQGKSKMFLESEQLRVQLLNRGDMFWDRVEGTPQYFWPKSAQNKSPLFASSLWLSGMDSARNTFILCAQTYSSNGNLRCFWPGPITLSGTDSLYRDQTQCSFWDRHFSMSRASLDSFCEALQSQPLPLSETALPIEIKEWPGRSNAWLKQKAQAIGLQDVRSLDQSLAPFIDVNQNGLYEPEWGDYPDLGKKTSMVWWVMNDAGGTKKFGDRNLTPGFFEFQVLAYAYPAIEDQRYLENTLFLEWKILNKGPYDLSSTYVSAWADPDLGNAGDDFIGCHPHKNLGFAYNADELDEGPNGYGDHIPALGIKVLHAPGPKAETDGFDNNRNGQTDEAGELLIFSGFQDYVPGGPMVADPQVCGAPIFPEDIYRYQQMRWRNNQPFTFGGTGLFPASAEHPPTRFMFPGNNDPYGFSIGGTVLQPRQLPGIWTEASTGNVPGDRRMLITSGPFDFSSGSSISYQYAILIGHGGENVGENVSRLFQTSDSLDLFRARLEQLDAQALLNCAFQPEVLVFPNPGEGRVEIRSPEEIELVELFDLQGRLIHRQKPGSIKTYLQVKGLARSVYLVRISGQSGVKTKKLMVR